MSIPYFVANGWEAEVVVVDEQYSDLPTDQLLLQSIPEDIRIHKVKALPKNLTSKFGLGSIALRSLPFYKKKIRSLLKSKQYDLIYFSTTQFPVCILGAYLKKRFGIPYVIDMQDPWHSDYYQNKPKAQRPRKYWFSYRLNKYLEPIALNNADGLISVSDHYITDLKNRYPRIQHIPAATITFGAFEPDMEIAEKNQSNFPKLLDDSHVNIVYVGRGGADMQKAVSTLFKAFKAGLDAGNKALEAARFYFIGTSYAPAGEGKPSILPVADHFGVTGYVTEITDRISYYHTLLTLKQADTLFIPGSDDPKYTASKIYPYLLTQKPILAIFNASSSAIGIMKEYGVKQVYNYDTVTDDEINTFLLSIVQGNEPLPNYNEEAADKYSARQMTVEQCKLFDRVISGKN
ncbi:glycosyltransferase family 4 protein [Mucilaginibacter rubeus]|uniref:Glycosyltransferase family 4 protein n=2 Tax=Mucilaginibacter rubeus TaxID=2027860 RepID=A0A5C1I9Z7_9SPHI|nr:glycosyltransferase family 4 protein [Mucilaginibacter rubeus]